MEGPNGHQAIPQPGIVYYIPAPSQGIELTGYPVLYQPLQPSLQPPVVVPQTPTPVVVSPTSTPVVVSPTPAPFVIPPQSVVELDPEADNAKNDKSKPVLTLKEKIQSYPSKVDITRWLSEAFNLYKQNYNWLMLTLWAFLVLALGLVPYGVGMIFAIPLSAGLYISSANAIRVTSTHPNNMKFKDLFMGFTLIFQLYAQAFLVCMLVAIGLICLILPGLYFMYTLQFAYLVYIEFHPLGLGIIDSMRVSLHNTRKHFWHIVIYTIIIGSIAASGIFAFGVGILFTLPLAYLTHVFALRDLFGLRESHDF